MAQISTKKAEFMLAIIIFIYSFSEFSAKRFDRIFLYQLLNIDFFRAHFEKIFQLRCFSYSYGRLKIANLG